MSGAGATSPETCELANKAERALMLWRLIEAGADKEAKSVLFAVI